MSIGSGGSSGGTYTKKQNTPCGWCVRAIKWIPVLFIVAIIGWSYYAYVVQLCIYSVETIVEQILFLLFFHILFIMFIWSYWQTIFTHIATVPQKFRIPRSEIEKLTNADSQEAQKRILETFARDLPLNNRTITGSIRFCEKCMLIKPDRAHHCSVCGSCVLKMDHHCPWVNNCVSFTNYKFFVLFLGYALVYCFYIAITTLSYFILFWKSFSQGELNGGVGRFHILFLFFVSVMFGISLISLFGYHIYLITLNRTTLEAFRAPIFRVAGPDKNGYNLGHYNNIQEVFGDNRRLWLLPIFSSRGDGTEYPVRTSHMFMAPVYESMGDTATRLDVVNLPTSKSNNNNISTDISISSDDVDNVDDDAIATNSQNILIVPSKDSYCTNTVQPTTSSSANKYGIHDINPII